MALIKLGALSEMPPGCLRQVEAAGQTFAVFNHEGEIRVFDGECPCAGGPLGRGQIFDGVLVCPWHGMRYDLDSGQCVLNYDLSVRRHDLRIDGDDILVDV